MRGASSSGALRSSGENPDVALAMQFAERDYFLLGRARIGLGVGEHQLFRRHGVDSVRLDVEIVIVTNDKRHFEKTPRIENATLCGRASQHAGAVPAPFTLARTFVVIGSKDATA